MRTYLSILALAALTTAGMASGEDDAQRIEAGKRRDPFSFALAAPDPDNTPIPPKPPGPAESDLQATRRKLDDLYSRADALMLDGNPEGALRASDEALAILQGLRPEDRSTFDRQREDLLRISKAAQRSLQRSASEIEFKRLNIAVTGLLIRERQAQAIVNAKLLSPGDFVPVPNSDDAPSVLVREIRKNEIVLRFRGYLMSLEIKTDPVR